MYILHYELIKTKTIMGKSFRIYNSTQNHEVSTGSRDPWCDLYTVMHRYNWHHTDKISSSGGYCSGADPCEGGGFRFKTKKEKLQSYIAKTKEYNHNFEYDPTKNYYLEPNRCVFVDVLPEYNDNDNENDGYLKKIEPFDDILSDITASISENSSDGEGYYVDDDHQDDEKSNDASDANHCVNESSNDTRDANHCVNESSTDTRDAIHCIDESSNDTIDDCQSKDIKPLEKNKSIMYLDDYDFYQKITNNNNKPYPGDHCPAWENGICKICKYEFDPNDIINDDEANITKRYAVLDCVESIDD